MREIKYLSHLSRNIFIYFFLFLVSTLVLKTSITLQTFFIGLITYFIAYAPVYFFNDFADYKEDSTYKKSNLYLSFGNKKAFWTVALSLLVTGFFLSYSITPLSISLLVTLYIMNLAYSYPPLRIRDRPFFREVLYFIITIVKIYLVLLYLHQPLSNFPLLVIVMGSSMMSFGLTLYKRYLGETKLVGALFGAIFLISWLLTIVVYKPLFWLLFPLVPLSLLLFFKYKNKQIPIGIYQFIYFIYGICIYVFYKS